jgi:capsular polysaccharide biosynthesis protein
MANFFDNQNLLDMVWKWKKHLIVVGVAAVILSAFFSSSTFIRPKYRSTARIYPSNNIYSFSKESQSEQLLELVNSLDIKLHTIEAFNLSEVYKIPRTDPHYLTYILGEFNDNVRFRKTEYESIEISVLDTDPRRACTMCDSIVSFLDAEVRRIHRIKYVEVAQIAQNDMRRLRHTLDSLETRLDTLRRNFNLLEYDQQAKEITRGMVNLMTGQKENTTGGRELKQWMKIFSEKGGQLQILEMRKKYTVQLLDSTYKIYEQGISGATKKISYGQIVQHPVVSDKKAYPVRWLIVLASTFAALFLAFMVVLVIENKKAV